MDVYNDNKSVEYVFLGNSGLKVSNLCLGGMNFGPLTGEDFLSKYFAGPTQKDRDTSFQILDKFTELGGNFIDTADVYAKGKSEEIIGEWLSQRDREKVVIATKVGAPFDITDPNYKGTSRQNIMRSVEGSLRRFKIDHIDLYQIHLWDDGTPIEETLRTMDDLVRCGKIRYFGVSNVSGWQLQKMVEISKNKGFCSPISLQQNYNLMVRTAELEPFKVCKNEGIAVIPFSPLAGGRLTGRFKRGETLDPTSRVGYYEANSLEFHNYKMDDKYWIMIEELGKIAKTHGKTIAQVSLRWLIQKDVVASPIIGPSSVKQLEDCMAVGKGWNLSQEEMTKLDELSAYEIPYPYDTVVGFNRDRQNPYKQ